jgi:hypothetical protein
MSNPDDRSPFPSPDSAETPPSSSSTVNNTHAELLLQIGSSLTLGFSSCSFRDTFRAATGHRGVLAADERRRADLLPPPPRRLSVSVSPRPILIARRTRYSSLVLEPAE